MNDVGLKPHGRIKSSVAMTASEPHRAEAPDREVRQAVSREIRRHERRSRVCTGQRRSFDEHCRAAGRAGGAGRGRCRRGDSRDCEEESEGGLHTIWDRDQVIPEPERAQAAP